MKSWSQKPGKFRGVRCVTACGMPFEYCEFSGAPCSKQEAETDATAQQSGHEQQLSDELREKAAITDAKRGAGKKDGAPVRFLGCRKDAKTTMMADTAVILRPLL